MGDAAATGHFSIGSGTRLAFDNDRPGRAPAHRVHGVEERSGATRTSGGSRCSGCNRRRATASEWFEQCERYLDLHPVQFNYSLLTRSQRISPENLRLRDPAWLRSAEDWFQEQAGGTPGRAPMFAPFRLRGMELINRVVVSPMAQYKAVDGCPTDGASFHYAERAEGGAGLVYTEMTCVSPEGRITPGCTGLYAQHEAAWRRLTTFVHAETAKICCQIGHSGRKGQHATRLGGDRPATGRWQLAR